MTNIPRFIIIHCSDVSERTIWDQAISINRYHKEREFSLSRLGFYTGYHVLITGGKVYRTRGDEEEGCHTNQQVDGLTMNLQSLGVCIGFDGDVEFPSQVHYVLLKKQVLDWQTQYNIPDENVRFHRYYATQKTCPGALLDQKWITSLLYKKSQTVPKVPTQEEKQANIIEIQNQLGILTKLLIQLQALYNQLFKK